MDVSPLAPEPPAGEPKPAKKRRWPAIVGALAVVAGVLGLIGHHLVMEQRLKSQLGLVECNIRQLSAAADQYYLEYGVTSVHLSNLVGPTAYLRALQRIDGEEYPAKFVQGGIITVTGLAGLRTVTYAP